MRIFLAGATGAIGVRLVPMLVEAGHDVVGTSRTPAKAEAIAAAGAQPVVLDALDKAAVTRAVVDAKPDVVIHQLSALTRAGNLRKFDTEFALTNRLRTEATDHLLAAASEAGATRFLAQSYTGWPNARSGPMVKTEEDPLDPDPPSVARDALQAIRYVESTVPAAEGLEGLVLRYGTFYGPGTGLTDGGEQVELVRRRRLPVIGGGGGVWSFVHIDDAASATVAALTHGEKGIYNIVDSDPAPVTLWLPALADAIGAKPPMRMPTWLARPLIGAHGVAMMTQMRGSSNAKAVRELGWQPAHPSWREGFRTALR